MTEADPAAAVVSQTRPLPIIVPRQRRAVGRAAVPPQAPLMTPGQEFRSRRRSVSRTRSSRPDWTCARCARPWPCGLARAELAQRYTRLQLAVIMADYLYIAAGEIHDAQPGALWDRLLLWTRRVP